MLKYHRLTGLKLKSDGLNFRTKEVKDQNTKTRLRTDGGRGMRHFNPFIILDDVSRRPIISIFVLNDFTNLITDCVLFMNS